jgi:hypothetical protein
MNFGPLKLIGGANESRRPILGSEISMLETWVHQILPPKPELVRECRDFYNSYRFLRNLLSRGSLDFPLKQKYIDAGLDGFSAFDTFITGEFIILLDWTFGDPPYLMVLDPIDITLTPEGLSSTLPLYLGDYSTILPGQNLYIPGKTEIHYLFLDATWQPGMVPETEIHYLFLDATWQPGMVPEVARGTSLLEPLLPQLRQYKKLDKPCRSQRKIRRGIESSLERIRPLLVHYHLSK